MAMNPAKLAFSVNMAVSTSDLRKALEATGLSLDNESLFRARHEMAALLTKEMDRLLAEVAVNVKKAKEA